MPDSLDMHQRRVSWDRRLNVLAIVMIAAIVPTAWWGIRSAVEAGRQASCVGQLKMISGGMLNYESARRVFPPAHFLDRQGRPAHSWRIAVLPYVGGYDVVDRYHFNEPWNSPHNASLAHGAPAGMTFFYPLYHCPSDRNSSKWDTSYVMVVGPNTISSGPRSAKLSEITAGISNTIMVAEMCESGIHWMEPGDLRVEEMSFKVNDPETIGIASRHNGLANVVIADGSVRYLPNDLPPQIVEAMTGAGKRDRSND